MKKGTLMNVQSMRLDPYFVGFFPLKSRELTLASFLFKILPYCNGLNDADGELVNKKFVVEHLLENNYEHLLKFIELFQL